VAAFEDIARIVYGHPTLSEVVKEAALAVDKRTPNDRGPERAASKVGY
jgi:dihydrolipoamide dehydrogenase